MNKKDFDILYKLSVLNTHEIIKFFLYTICCMILFTLLKLSGIVLFLFISLATLLSTINYYIAYKKIIKLCYEVK